MIKTLRWIIIIDRYFVLFDECLNSQLYTFDSFVSFLTIFQKEVCQKNSWDRVYLYLYLRRIEDLANLEQRMKLFFSVENNRINNSIFL